MTLKWRCLLRSRIALETSVPPGRLFAHRQVDTATRFLAHENQDKWPEAKRALKQKPPALTPARLQSLNVLVGRHGLEPWTKGL
ncbi:MAG: hypothetical protein RL357_547 [Pseudomonadota bacterium]